MVHFIWKDLETWKIFSKKILKVKDRAGLFFWINIFSSFIFQLGCMNYVQFDVILVILAKFAQWTDLPETQPAITCSKFNNRNKRTSCEICSKLTLKTPENIWIYFTPCSSVSIVNFEQVNTRWELILLRALQPRS